MVKKVLFIIALSIFIFSYVRAEEVKTPTFSFEQPQEWKTAVREQHKIKITKTYPDGSTNTILFASTDNLESRGRTAREMLPATLELVKEVNKMFKRYLENNKVSNLPPIAKVEEVDTSRAKVGSFRCIMSSLMLIPLDNTITPIAFISMTALENGHRYTISITVKTVTVDGTEALLEEAFKIVETYKTFQNGMTPV